MKYLEWLRGLSEKERKVELEKNKHISRGSYVTSTDILKNLDYYKKENNITDYTKKVIERYKDKVVVANSQKNIKILSLVDVTLLTEDVYNKLIEAVYTPGKNISNIKTIFKYLTPQLHAMYGEENVDIETFDTNTLRLKIKYPKLTITNSNGFSRDFYDTYVTHKFTKVGEKLYILPQVFRAKGTIGEHRSGYYFSHISGQLGGYSRNFCCGDNPLNYILKHEKFISFTDIIFYLVQFNEFMQWESIEGGPYKLINNIKDFVVDPSSAYFNSGAPTDEEILEILEYIESFHYTFISETSVKIDTVVLSNALKRFLLDKGRLDCLGVEHGTSHGTPRKLENSTVDINSLDLERYSFKGEEIRFSFIDENNIELPEITEDHLTPNPQDFYSLQKYLEEKFIPYLRKHLLAKYD